MTDSRFFVTASLLLEWWSGSVPFSNRLSETAFRFFSPPVRRHSAFSIHNFQFTIHDSRFTIHNSQFTIHDSQFTIHNSQFTIHNSKTINNSKTIHNSQFKKWSWFVIQKMLIRFDSIRSIRFHLGFGFLKRFRA